MHIRLSPADIIIEFSKKVFCLAVIFLVIISLYNRSSPNFLSRCGKFVCLRDSSEYRVFSKFF